MPVSTLFPGKQEASCYIPYIGIFQAVLRQSNYEKIPLMIHTYTRSQLSNFT